jgi:hypothetical protein
MKQLLHTDARLGEVAPRLAAAALRIEEDLKDAPAGRTVQRTLSAAALATLVTVLGGTAAADPPTAPSASARPTSARVASCRAASDAICKAHLACLNVPGVSEALYTDMAGCRTAWARTCSESPQDRPARTTPVDATACLASAKAASRTAAHCATLHDQETTPECDRYIAQVFSRDYATHGDTTPCGAGYVRDADGAGCSLSCRSGADCSPTGETCGNDKRAGVCVAVPAPRRR